MGGAGTLLVVCLYHAPCCVPLPRISLQQKETWCVHAVHIKFSGHTGINSLTATRLTVIVICQVVEEARRRLLEQHGAAVEGYLPKGSLKSRDELELVRDLSRKKNMETNGSDAVDRYLSSPLPG